MVKNNSRSSRVGEYLTYEEYQLIYNQARKNKNRERRKRDTTLIELLWRTGLRIGDVLDLRINDIILDENTIRRKLQKTGKLVEIPIPPELTEKILDIYDVERRKDGRIFTIKYEWVREFIRDYAEEAGINKNVHPHMFRHGMATYLLNVKGVDMKTISNILGHKSIAITADIYTDITLDKKRKALDLA